MAKKQYFENLLGAMQESILKAHSMIENQHLNVMKRYFDESQKPLTFDIQYPRINPDTGELEYVLVQVPKIALVPMNSLKLKEMKLKFKVTGRTAVRLTYDDTVVEGSQNDLYCEFAFEGEDFDGKSNDSGLLANILSSNKTDTDNFVDVELLFESNDPPEAVMKINDQMVKILP